MNHENEQMGFKWWMITLIKCTNQIKDNEIKWIRLELLELWSINELEAVFSLKTLESTMNFIEWLP